LQLSEISVDLAEEHTTSSKATELLESETVGRIQMERELKEMSVSEFTSVCVLELPWMHRWCYLTNMVKGVS